MTSYTVTIKDITAWTIRVRAKGSLEAEDIAWELFQRSGDRSEHFAEDSDTTVQVEEVEPPHSKATSMPINESTEL